MFIPEDVVAVAPEDADRPALGKFHRATAYENRIYRAIDGRDMIEEEFTRHLRNWLWCWFQEGDDPLDSADPEPAIERPVAPEQEEAAQAGL